MRPPGESQVVAVRLVRRIGLDHRKTFVARGQLASHLIIVMLSIALHLYRAPTWSQSSAQSRHSAGNFGLADGHASGPVLLAAAARVPVLLSDQERLELEGQRRRLWMLLVASGAAGGRRGRATATPPELEGAEEPAENNGEEEASAGPAAPDNGSSGGDNNERPDEEQSEPSPANYSEQQEASPLSVADGSNNNNHNSLNAPVCNQMSNVKSGRPSITIRLVFFSLYALIFAIGLLGNTLTLYAMRRKREKSSVIDMFIANLALSDIMLCIFAVPITPIYMLHYGHWVFGPGLCKAFAFAQGSSVYISTFTMISIAQVRYQLIVHPLHDSMSKLTALLLNLCTWILGFLVTLPYLMHVVLLPENCAIKFCDEHWEEDIDRFWFSVITLMLQFFLPFTAVSFFYGSIFWKLRLQKRRRQREAGGRRALPPAGPRPARDPHSAAPDECRTTNATLTAGLECAPAGPELGSITLASSGVMTSVTLPQLAAAAAEKRRRAPADRDALCWHEEDEDEERLAEARPLRRALSQLGPEPEPEPGRDFRRVRSPGALQPSASAASLERPPRPAERPAPAPRPQQAPPTKGILAMKELRLREKDKRLSQTNRKLLFMVVLFVFSWLPLNMFNLVQDYSETISESPYIKHVFLIVHLIACSSVCYNPILYAWMSDNYRQELRDILPAGLAKKCCCLQATGKA